MSAAYISTAPAASSGGDVAGPAVAVSGDLASFSGTTGKIIQDSGIASTNVVTETANAAAANRIMTSAGADKTVQGTAATLTTAGAMGGITTFSASGAVTLSVAGATSTAATIWTGAILTGGSGTTNFPHLFIQPTGTTAQTNWSTAGTVIGINMPNAFAGDYLKIQSVGNANLLVMASSGIVTVSNQLNALNLNATGFVSAGTNALLGWASGVYASGVSATVFKVANNAQTSGYCISTGTNNTMIVRNLANSADGSIQALNGVFGGPVTLKGYTVATLPAGTQGMTAFVTDALGPAFLVAVVGGGAVVSTVFYNGTTWVAQ